VLRGVRGPRPAGVPAQPLQLPPLPAKTGSGQRLYHARKTSSEHLSGFINSSVRDSRYVIELPADADRSTIHPPLYFSPHSTIPPHASLSPPGLTTVIRFT